MAFTTDIGTSSNVYLDALQYGGYVWSNTGNYGDHAHIRYFFSNSGANDTAWTDIEMGAYRTALQSFANVANISFSEAGSAASSDLIAHSVAAEVIDGNLGEHDTPLIAAGQGHYAHGYFNYQGTGWDHGNPNGGLSVGGYGYLTLIHELGHGLGLAHPHDNGGGSGIFAGVTGPYSTGSNGLNQGVWTVMSYNATQGPATANTNQPGSSYLYVNGQAATTYGYYAGPMAFDIAALQDLYGANTDFHGGNDPYMLPDQNGLGTYWTCIWDTGGTDAIGYAGSRNVTISLAAATLDNTPTGGGVMSSAEGIHGGYTIANGVMIENAFGGSGNDSLTGNQGDNNINGNGGTDTMRGLAGNDAYLVDNTGDVVIEQAGQGTDTIRSSVSYTLPANVERLMLVGGTVGVAGTGTGNGDTIDATERSVGVRLFGRGGADTLIGSSYNDIVEGGTEGDSMRGLNGDDTYYVDSTLDTVAELVNYGYDTISSLVSYTLPVNVERLLLTGGAAGVTGTGGGGHDTINAAQRTAGVTLYGNGGKDTLTGSNYADTIYGGEEADVIFSSTALNGIDRLFGGLGNDIYHVRQTNTQITELANEGALDTVNSTVTFTLAANIERLNLVGGTATGTGNSGDNTLDGLTATGSLTLDGADGRDTIYGSSNGDWITGGTGDDTLAGRGGADRFRFLAAGFGNDRIIDFQDGLDRIDLTGRGFSAASIGSSIVIGQSGANAFIDIGNDLITLNGITASTITASDFIF